jgi:hypothetical protein
MDAMKRMLYLILTVLFVSSCATDEEVYDMCILPMPIIGQWQLTAQYNDPGDGSGTFEPVENGKVITVNDGGTWDCNVSICYGSLTQATTSGTYTASQFVNTSCTVNYTFVNGVLELEHPCIESCLERYTRL